MCFAELFAFHTCAPYTVLISISAALLNQLSWFEVISVPSDAVCLSDSEINCPATSSTLTALPALMGMPFDAAGTGKRVRQGPDKVQGLHLTEGKAKEGVFGRAEPHAHGTWDLLPLSAALTYLVGRNGIC